MAFINLLLVATLVHGIAEQRDLSSKETHAPVRSSGSVRYNPETHVPVRSSGCGKGLGPYKKGATTTAYGSYAGVTRMFLVYVPDSYDANTAVPIVVAHHGWQGTAFDEVNGDGLQAEAGLHGFITVYPQGFADNDHPPPAGKTWGSWNCVGSVLSPGVAGPTCTSAASHPDYCYSSCGGCSDTPQCWWTTCVDDVTPSGTGKPTNVTGFIPALYNTLEGQLCIDMSREYATGFSNGGMMTFQLGASLGNRLAAIVPIAGSFHNGFNAAPSEGVAVLETHGNADNVVPANGTPPVGVGWYYTNMTEIFGGNAYSSGWKSSNGCSGSASHYATPFDGHNDLYCISEGSCSGGDVVRCTFSGGHAYAPDNGALAWWFLKQFTKPSHVGAGRSRGEPVVDSPIILETLEFDPADAEDDFLTSTSLVV